MADLIKDINSLAIFGGLRKREPLASLVKFLKIADEGYYLKVKWIGENH